MKYPDDVNLSQAEGKALIERLEAGQLTSEDRRVLVKLIEVYFWLTAALRESKLSLKRLKRMLFGDGAKPRKPGDDQGPGAAPAAPDEASATPDAEAPEPPPRGHGRQAAAEYPGATIVTCRHETLSVGERCPTCGRGKLYRLPPGVTIRIDGNALLTALRYEVEKRVLPVGVRDVGGKPKLRYLPRQPTRGDTDANDHRRRCRTSPERTGRTL